MVRLLQFYELIESDVYAQFQSHNGAIAAWEGDSPAEIAKSRFNPTMVRLLQVCHQTYHGLRTGFNPTMVRLLPENIETIERNYAVSIPQWCDCCDSEGNSKAASRSFNPTMVRLLPMVHAREMVHANNRFNPTMVRLLRDVGKRARLSCQVFQSHNGAIAAPINRATSPPPRVSIPQWCDCC